MKLANNSIESIITHFANNAYIEHKDVTKCGQCWKEKIKSDVAKEILEKKENLSNDTLEYFFKEVDSRWKQTPLFLRVKSLLDSGKTLETIQKELLKENIEI